MFDFLAALAGLVLIAPIFLAIALAIKLDSPGPVFYKGLRVGKQGKEFRMFKFRSMVQNADKIGGPSTAGDDPRLTRMGKFLKKFQLDELPQLINVIKGEMSIVGPRPEVPSEVKSLDFGTRKIMLSVKPGITSLATLANPHEGEILKGSKDPHKTYVEKIKPEKIRLNLEYVRKKSFWLDMKIIIETFFVAVFR
ncbi:MAG: Sugar transferase [Candidatus Roizmanbacteria bacterium GW2011_GWC2_41_7]|uniref:Sugar transferase n=1 Tax=Candidatus Roizmanbacteria bacterium GW2011_GWC2_41_7 TaxID=1618487 RepID=A0A0G0X304_9BACT|nr:MAG: Sugar transferase [Candidatus Roizmanbacteria bacterium GW2011_GWC2_41_7]